MRRKVFPTRDAQTKGYEGPGCLEFRTWEPGSVSSGPEGALSRQLHSQAKSLALLFQFVADQGGGTTTSSTTLPHSSPHAGTPSSRRPCLDRVSAIRVCGKMNDRRPSHPNLKQEAQKIQAFLL